MSNLLNNQIGQALTNVGNALQQQELTEFNTLRGAKLSLYHAHSITSKAEGELREHQAQSQKAAEQSKIAAIGVNATANVALVAKAAVLDASTTTSNAATAAASVQKAATALTVLSGNIATTLAVANTLDKGSKIQSLVEKANKATVAAAELAEQASLIALNLTIEASQSRAASVVTQSDDVKSKMAALQKSLSDTFGKHQDLITEDQEAVDSAVGAESQQAGIYKTAIAEDQALQQSSDFINRHINNDLQFKIGEFDSPLGENLSGDVFTLSFTPVENSEDEVKNISLYRIIIVKADDAASFNVESAKSVPSRHCVQLDVKTSPGKYKQTYYLANASSEIDSNIGQNLLSSQGQQNQDEKPALAIDQSGQPVMRGTPYKFFVHVIYTSQYQDEHNDTIGMLSLPSQSFTLSTALPVVDQQNMAVAFYQKDGANCMHVVFKVPTDAMKLLNGTDLNEIMEFRTFFFNQKDQKAYSINNSIDSQASELVKSEDDFRLKEEAYLQEKLVYETAVSGEAPPEQINILKKNLDAAKSMFLNAKSKYNDDQMRLDQWVERKISDFTFDTEIALTIPASNYQVANLNPRFFDQWKTMDNKVVIAKREIKNSDESLSKMSKDYEDVSKQIQSAQEPFNTKIKKTDQDIAKHIELLKESLKMEVIIRSEEEAEEFKKNLSQYQTVSRSISIKIKKTGNKTEDFKFDEEETDPDKNKKESQWIDQVINDFKDLKNLKDQLAGSPELVDLRKKQNEINTELIVLKAEVSRWEDKLSDLATKAKELKPIKDKFASAAADGFSYFEAINTKGDFLDNFGEPLIVGEEYCVAVLSTIKSTKPDDAPLFQSVLSDFSDPSLFNLQQI